MSIDLSASYAKAVREALPDAVLVADRYHLVQLGNDMLTQVRQRVIRETEGRRGRKSDPASMATCTYQYCESPSNGMSPNRVSVSTVMMKP